MGSSSAPRSIIPACFSVLADHRAHAGEPTQARPVPKVIGRSQPGLAVVARAGLAGKRTFGIARTGGCGRCSGGLGSLEHLAGDGWWLAAGEDPAGEGSRNGNAEDSDGEVEDGHAAEIAEVAEVPGGQREVGGGGAEQRAEHGQRSGGDGGERAPGGAGGSGGGEGAQVAGGLGADQRDGHGEDPGGEQRSGAFRCGADRGEGGLGVPGLGDEPRWRGYGACGRELPGCEGLAALDEPAGRYL